MQCTKIKDDGKRCRAHCVGGGRFCFTYSPDTREEHHEATVKGGESRNRPTTHLPPETPDLPLRTMSDVTAALAETFNNVRTGRVGVNVGNCLALLGGALLKALESSDLERRLEGLEARVSPRARRTA